MCSGNNHYPIEKQVKKSSVIRTELNKIWDFAQCLFRLIFTVKSQVLSYVGQRLLINSCFSSLIFVFMFYWILYTLFVVVLMIRVSLLAVMRFDFQFKRFQLTLKKEVVHHFRKASLLWKKVRLLSITPFAFSASQLIFAMCCTHNVRNFVFKFNCEEKIWYL